MLPPGTYDRPEVCGQAVLKVGQNNTPVVKIKFRCADAAGASHFVVWDGWLTEKALPRTIEGLGYLGWDGDDIADINNGKPLSGEAASIVVNHEAGNDGQTYARVQWVNAIGGGQPLEGMTMQDAQAFGLEMKAKIIAARRAGDANRKARMAGAGKSQERLADAHHEGNAASAASTYGEDEVPF